MYKKTIIIATLIFGINFPSLDAFAQNCSQLGIPKKALTRICTQDYGGTAIDLDFSSDNTMLAAVFNLYILIFDVPNRKIKTVIKTDNWRPRSIQFSSDGKSVLCGDAIYDLDEGKPKLLLSDSDGYDDYVIFSPDEKTIVGAGTKGLRFWSVDLEEEENESENIQDLNVLPTTIDQNNESEDDPIISVNHIATSEETMPDIQGIDYSPDGTEIAVACKFGVWIYDPILNKEITLLDGNMGGHKGQVSTVRYSPDGNILVSTGDGLVRLWDIKNKRLKSKLPDPKIRAFGGGQRPASFIISANIVVVPMWTHINFYDMSTGKYKYSLGETTDRISSAAISSDNKLIVSSSADTILFWDIASYPSVTISPDTINSLEVDQELSFDINITNAKNISGYQILLDYDSEKLEYIETQYADFLQDQLILQSKVSGNTVYLGSLSSSNSEIDGSGKLLTVKFKAKVAEDSVIELNNVVLSDSKGSKFYAWINDVEILPPPDCDFLNIKDVNRDCEINIQDLVLVATRLGSGSPKEYDVNSDGIIDIIDLVLVAGSLGNISGAPSIRENHQIAQWIEEAKRINSDDLVFQKGILALEQLLRKPPETKLLSNYPNPFNPETWIPYQLSEPSNITLSIHSIEGNVIRTLSLGYKQQGLYHDRNKAIYWDGRNDVGETVSSGIYFYTLITKNSTQTKKMLILK
ncbi:T9SS type A sorting domain-containing protein [Candidatus Poribacteria bacterium]|nr:T9SS type A sorting domain-containing protein [Candidatus Poribacteria bacterium]